MPRQRQRRESRSERYGLGTTVSESRKAGFWIGLAVFQVLFGLVVFGLTREYYLDRPAPPRTGSSTLPAMLPQAFRDAVATLPATSPPPGSETPEAMAERADARFQARDYAEAAVLYERLVALDPGNPALLNNLGITLHYLGRSDEALARLNEGLAADPEHQRSWLTVGFVNAQLGRRDAAQAALENAVRLDAGNDVGQSAARMLTDMGFDASPD